MPVDTVSDLRQRAGDLAPRLGSLNHFMPAAQELLDIVHRLNSEILLRHNRKIVTLVEIARTTLTRAGLKLYSFSSCIPALQNYKTLYFNILRALQERQEDIVDSENLRDRVTRLLMPLSTWLVIHQGDSSAATSFSAPASPDRDSTLTPLPHSPETSQKPRKSVPTTRRLSATGHPVTAPEKLMPPPSSLPHRFQQPPSITPRGWPFIPTQADQNHQSSGAIRMARTRIPRAPVPCVEPETLVLTDPEPQEKAPPPGPVLTQRRTQRFGIFFTAAGGSSGVRRRAMTVPRSGP